MERLLKLGISIILLFFLTQVPWVLAQSDDEILAKAGNEVITRIDFETRLKSFPYAAQQEFKDFEKKKQLLDMMIKARLLVTEGGNKGLTEKADIKAHLRMVRDDLITQEYVRAYIENKAEVSDEEAEKYYNTNPEIREREYLKVSQIVVEKEEEAKEILGRLKKEEHFNKLAKERSIDPASKAKAGELDWFEKGKKEKEIEDALAKLEKGGISDIVKTKGGYYILKLDERKIVPKPPYLKLKDEIIGRLKYQKTAELVEKEIEELKKKMNIETFYEKLSSEGK
jgi:peptidyl-prolyl cis-trans isomerase C